MILLTVGSSGVWCIRRQQRQMKLDQSLVSAIKLSRSNMVRIWLDEGADPNAQEISTVTLDFNAYLRNWEAKILSNHHAANSSPLLLATQQAPISDDIVLLLLNKGANTNVKDSQGYTALLYASSKGEERVSKWLVDKGAKVRISDPDGNTPLYYAVKYTDLDLTETLILHGADVNAPNNAGFTPLLSAVTAASEQGSAEVKLLLKAGAKVNATLPGRMSALMMAVICDWTEVVKLLIMNGAYINAQDNRGYTALTWAAFYGQTNSGRILIAAGANPNILSHDGYTALQVARNGTRPKESFIRLLSESRGKRNLHRKKNL